MANEPVQIRRYPNRRLYDRQRKQYVTLREIEDLVRDGNTVEVRDSKSGDDLTRAILTQILIEQHPERMETIPVAMLHSLLRSNDLVMEFWRWSLKRSLLLLDRWQAGGMPVSGPLEWMNSVWTGWMNPDSLPSPGAGPSPAKSPSTEPAPASSPASPGVDSLRSALQAVGDPSSSSSPAALASFPFLGWPGLSSAASFWGNTTSSRSSDSPELSPSPGGEHGRAAPNPPTAPANPDLAHRLSELERRIHQLESSPTIISRGEDGSRAVQPEHSSVEQLEQRLHELEEHSPSR